MFGLAQFVGRRPFREVEPHGAAAAASQPASQPGETATAMQNPVQWQQYRTHVACDS